MYEVIRKIGTGAFGRVYLLQSSQYQYALKVVNELESKDDDNRGDQLLLRLRHAHLVQCWDAFLCGSNLYYVLELCSCGSLDQYLVDRKKLLSQSRILVWSSQIADVLRYLHAMNVIHRDLKPANIFLDKKKDIKVGDLGIAKQLEFTNEQAKTAIGSLCYMSPELHSGDSYDFKVDMWSLGCCIHEMMTLNKTFIGQSIMELFHKITTVLVPGVPNIYEEGLRELVLSLLSLDPADRPDALHILFLLSKLRGQKFRPTSARADECESFNHQQICKALEKFESSSTRRNKIVPLKVSVQDNELTDLSVAKTVVKTRKKKKLTAIKNFTPNEKSEVDSFMERLYEESMTWLREQNESHYKKKPPDTEMSDPCSVSLSTKCQSVSFMKKKMLMDNSEKDYTTYKNSIYERCQDKPSKQVNEVAQSMMKLCQGQSEHLSQLMLLRVRAQHHQPSTVESQH